MAYVKCKYLLVAPNKSGKVITRSNETYLCSVELPEYEWPASVKYPYGWVENQAPSKVRVSKADCAECPFFEAETNVPRSEGE